MKTRVSYMENIKSSSLKERLVERLKSSNGNVAIEFAFVLPVLLLLIIAALDFGLVEWNKIYVRSAVNAGIDYALGVSSTPGLVQTAIQNATPLSNLTISVTQFCQCSDNSSIACTGTCPGGTTPDKYISINVQTNVSLSGVYSFVANPYPITETATVMIQ
jgi:Flp pilus assembly protein TadG